jgi:peptide/nickel transport system ATP-binding protein
MGDRPPLVRVRGLTRTYVRRQGPRATRHVQALAGVDLDIAPGTALALVGQSGSGKSTLARCVARLEEPTSGTIWIEGEDVTFPTAARRRALRERVQLLFQDSAGALDPRLRAAEIVREPLDILGRGGRAEREERALSLMESVGLAREWKDRRPLDLSGGQRQRLALARALAVEPRLLILDEAFAGLDASIQAQIASLLLALRRAKGLTYLLISHDLGLMSVLADEVAILFEGRIVEQGPAARLFTHPVHPYTRALVAAVPSLPDLRPPSPAAGP